MMKHVQWLVIIAIALVLVALCFVEVMRGEDPRTANKEALTTDLANLALRAQEYYHRPQAKGGGGGTFAGLTADASGLAKLTSKQRNSNGTFAVIVAGNSYQVDLEAFGTQRGTDGNPICVRIDVFADSTSLVFLN